MDKQSFYRDARGDLTGPLAGVRVLDATTAWSGPMAGCLLADLGADVVRIVPPGDPGLRWPPHLPGTSARSFAEETVNRNKRSVAIDLRQAAGAEVFLRLVRDADVVLENFKPGTLDGWGVGYRQCAAVKPDLVFVSISGWGQFGPRHARPGYDPAALAYGGWQSLNGSPDGPPTKAPTFLCDDLAGLHAALSALAALHHRGRTGEGQHVDVALLDAILFQSNGLLTLGASEVPLQRWGNELAVSAPSNNYACADGHVYIGLVLDSHWRALCEVMGRPEFASAPGFATNLERVEQRQAINALVGGWAATRTRADILAALDAAGIVCAPVNDYATAARDAHVLARDMLQPTVLSDGSTVPLTGPAAKFSRTPTRVRHAAPVPGAQTEEVLTAAGYDEASLARLRAQGAIG